MRGVLQASPSSSSAQVIVSPALCPVSRQKLVATSSQASVPHRAPVCHPSPPPPPLLRGGVAPSCQLVAESRQREFEISEL
ncbi:hypothetical protein AGIG_G5037 [Arapaima gigas]